LVDDEVSVAELLVREGWGDDESPAARSRWRVVAVMLAVVIGCGTAAVLVAFNGTPRQDAEQVDQIRVIPMPDRTTGLGGADQSTDSPGEGGVGGGTGDSPGSTRTTHTVGHNVTSTAPPSETPTSAPPVTSGTSSPFAPTSGPATSETPTQQPAPPAPPPTTTRQTCILFICWP
jgi:hypothetical protein